VVEASRPGDKSVLPRMSIIEDGSDGSRHVRMAHLAIVGSHAVNGVAALHSELIKKTLVPDFHRLWPDRFHNMTNGVTQRRWLLKANPGLADLLTEAVGEKWITDLEALREIEPLAAEAGFRTRVLAIKRENKERLARVIKETTGEKVDPDSLFDVIAKRIHEYKRQLLMAMRAMHEYLCIVEDRKDPIVPRTYIFAGKAAPGYWAAKQIIKLVNDLARVVNHDPRVRGRIRVVFVPDYRVSLAEKIIPAADLSEQISTAGKEASGTSNMKFAMNGALTICTRDGANLEIMDAVGEDNIYTFGLSSEEVADLRASGRYQPWDFYHRNEQIRRVMDAFNSDRMFARDHANFHWIFHSIMNGGDQYFHLADFEGYLEAQARAAHEFRQPDIWGAKSVLNIARMGRFSSDRTIREYADKIWGVQPVR
jgi:starch phosphorylase